MKDTFLGMLKFEIDCLYHQQAKKVNLKDILN